MPDYDLDLTPEIRGELSARVSAMDHGQVMPRLLELTAYRRPTAAQRAERDMLTERQIWIESMADRGIDVVNPDPSALMARADRGGNLPPNRPPGSQPRPPSGRYADRAYRVLDALHRRGLPDHGAAVADRVCRSPMGAGDDPEGARDLGQRWLAVCGSPEYERAFASIVADPVGGGAALTEAERAAWRAGRQVQNALGEGGSGNYLVPVMLDPTILLSSAGSSNPLRQVARVETIVTSEWRGVTGSTTAEWLGAGSEAADKTPTLLQPEVPVFKASSFVPFDVELEADAQDLMGQLGSVLTDAAEVLRSAAYVTGGGSTEPSGFVPGSTAVDNASGAFVAADVRTLQNSLPPRFSAGASWLANIAVLNQVGQFETTNGALAFPELRTGNPPSLLHKPARECSDMSGDYSTTGSLFLAYGDFAKGFLIADRIGATIELVSHLFGANGRPTGQRGAFLWLRTGSDVLIPAAISVLKKTA